MTTKEAVKRTRLSRRIESARKAMRPKISCETLAHMVGVTRDTIVNYESGQTEPTVSMVRAIAKATGKPLAFFISDVMPAKD